ncbi:MAG: hypothetical protein SFV17_01725 [Candidatus Obscuribacter sp.]|nr:hypothetical protein [Candidatus Obscuribacter sp.]
MIRFLREPDNSILPSWYRRSTKLERLRVMPLETLDRFNQTVCL